MRHKWHAANADPLFETEKKRTLVESWDKMQRFQTDFAIAQELTFYYTSPAWRRAKTVLDLGTGNGYYLRRLACCFPEKTYHGVDLSAEFIAIAEQEATNVNVSFSHRSLYEVVEVYDFVLMRLLLQHMEDVNAVLEHVATLIHPGQAALIIDAYDPVRYFYPDLPEFMEFFAAYAQHEWEAGRDRRVAERVERAIGSSRQWRWGDTLPLVIPSMIPGNLELFAQTYTLLIDLVEQVGALQYDFTRVKEAWKRWVKRPDAYTQVGLTLIRIDRV